jgi:hypothetical protein
MNSEDLMKEAWALIVAILNEPDVRAVTVLFSALSLVFSIWAFRKTSIAANTFVRHVGAEHARLLEGQWAQAYNMTLSNGDFARHTSQLFGYASEDDAKRDAVLLFYLNIMLTSFRAAKAGVLPSKEHKTHLTSFFGSIHGDRDALLQLLELPGYEEEFRQECRKLLLAAGNAANASEMPGGGKG